MCGIRTGPSIDPVIIFARSTPHSRHLRRPSRHVAPSRISANGVVLHCEIIAHYTFPCPAHWARSRRSASIAPRSSRRPRTRHVPRSRTRDETRTASTYRCEPPRSSTKCAPQRANGGAWTLHPVPHLSSRGRSSTPAHLLTRSWSARARIASTSTNRQAGGRAVLAWRRAERLGVALVLEREPSIV